MAGTFQCTVVTPEASVFDEQVTYANVPAHDGQIGFMPHRAPILLQLGKGVMRLDLAGGGQKSADIDGGFAQMRGDRLTILTDRAEIR